MPRIRPPCFTGIWRDCASNYGYFEFSDGSRYEYPEGADVATTCANHLLRGVTYNLPFNRRPLLGFRPYARIEEIPDDAVQLFPGTPPEGRDDFPPCADTFDWSQFNGQDDHESGDGFAIDVTTVATAHHVVVTGSANTTDGSLPVITAADVIDHVSVNIHWKFSGTLVGDNAYLQVSMGTAPFSGDIIEAAPFEPYIFSGPGPFEIEGDSPLLGIYVAPVYITTIFGDGTDGTPSGEWTWEFTITAAD